MPVSFRDAEPDDIPAILAIEQAAAMAAHWNAGQYKVRIQDRNVMVAEKNGEILGFLCVRVAAGDWEIENVVVDARLRRQGIGVGLMRALLEKWQAASGATILLEVRESNASARTLYEKCGLLEAGRRRGYYCNPSEDAILYTRHRQT